MHVVRFRLLFWCVILLGALPSLVSGIVLVPHFLPDALCAPIRPIVSAAEYARLVRWERVHSFARGGALVAGVMVMGYAAAWAWEAGVSRRRRRALVALLIFALLPALAAALWSGRALPWQSLQPAISLGEDAPTILPGRSSEEQGGEAWCHEHAAEMRHLEWAWLAHVAGGALAIALTLAFADFGARWKRAREARS
jgi:hypothetical protein